MAIRVIPWPTALAVVLAACGPEPTADTTTASASSDGSDASSSGGGNLPATCDAATSPFVTGGCLDDLRTTCNALATASDCEAAAAFAFDGYVVACTWTEVARFADVTSCTVAEVTARCEAAMPTECGSTCDGEGLIGDVTAIGSSAELVRVCGGPLGPWSEVGAEQDDVMGCGTDAQGLCACLDAACAAY